MKKIEPERLVTFSIFARLFPRKKKERGVKTPYVYQLISDETSEAKRINPLIVEICGVRFIYLNEYALNLLQLSFDQAREMIRRQLKEDEEKAGTAGRPPRTVGKIERSDYDLYIED